MRRLFLALLLVPTFVHADPLQIADFSRDEDVSQVKISPDGKYLSHVRMINGDQYLAVMRLSDQKLTQSLEIGKERRVARYWWASPDRIVVSFGEQFDLMTQPFLTGELLGISADQESHTAATYLYGFRGVQPHLGTHIASANGMADYRFAKVIKTLPKDGHDVVIQIDAFAADKAAFAEVAKLDIYNGKRLTIAQSPTKDPTDFLADSNGYPRYAVTEDEHWNTVTYAKADPKDENWKVLGDGLKDTIIDPIALSSDDSRAYMLASENGAPACLVQQDLSSGVRTKLSCDDHASVTGMIMSFDRKEAIAATYSGAPPGIRLLDTQNPDRAKLQALEAAFPGQYLEFVSSTLDGDKVVLFTSSDRNPGDYYLFDPKTMKADYLISRHSWIDPDQMSEVHSISFKARDGQLIHGFLTLPKGKEAKNLPLVVHPHGGPFGEADSWEWDAEPQLLASRGYAVLQVNFRGSGGYGKNFEDAGRQHWDSVMINDITDGAKWTLQQGIAAPGRVCIYGASYGGYAALMSAVREPDLYKCTIGYAGVYDLNLWKKDTDVTETSRGKAFVADFVGATDDQLRAASPLAHIDQLKAAVMIIHGEDDLRVPFTQAEALRKALDARKYPYEWLSKPHEGHGFYDPKNREELYEKLVAFLDKNIGAPAAVADSGAAAVAPATPAPDEAKAK